jgi:hypothetical protein
MDIWNSVGGLVQSAAATVNGGRFAVPPKTVVDAERETE